jgi:hypothetical protein
MQDAGDLVQRGLFLFHAAGARGGGAALCQGGGHFQLGAGVAQGLAGGFGVGVGGAGGGRGAA